MLVGTKQGRHPDHVAHLFTSSPPLAAPNAAKSDAAHEGLACRDAPCQGATPPARVFCSSSRLPTHVVYTSERL